MSTVTKRFDIVAGRKYQTSAGETKTQWLNCGDAAQWDDGGISLRINSMPVGNWFDGTLKLFEKKDDRQNSGSPASKPARGPQAKQAPVDDFEDQEIPFN